MAITTILGVFDEQESARQALDELQASGLALKDTSLVSQNGSTVSGGSTLSAPEGAAFGAAWGGLVGLVALVIPGIGPFIAGGALAAALTGAAAGAVVGGLAGALMHSANLSEAAAKRYETMVQAGKTIVAVRADETDALAVRRIMARDGADSIRENQTDILHRGPIELAIYDEAGREVNYAPNDDDTADVERTPELISQQGFVVRGGDLVSTREATLERSVPEDALQNSATSGRENSFDTEDIEDDTGYANGARVVSFDEENQQPASQPAPKDVPPA